MIDTPRVRKQTRHYNSFEDDELMEFSELDSDSEEKPCRTRRLGERSRRYLRAECFRVEKNLLIFGYAMFDLTVAKVSLPLPLAASRFHSSKCRFSALTVPMQVGSVEGHFKPRPI